VNGSLSGDDVFGQSSPAAKADEIYSDSDKITKELSSRSTQAVFLATCPSSFPLSGVVPAAAAPTLFVGPENGEPPGGGE
jgi:hypothetical protein